MTETILPPADFSQFFSRFDSVVMLTWSDWRTEMRGNRYHYATRFARHLPVLFVQPSLDEDEFRFEPSGDERITLVQIPSTPGPTRDRQLAAALHQAGANHPLLWIYNAYFSSFLSRIHADLKIYHATENYFAPEFFGKMGDAEAYGKLHCALRATIAECDGVLCVSEGVRHSYLENLQTPPPITVIGNACDFDFLAADSEPPAPSERPPVALYQGNISAKLDFNLLQAVAEALPDWEFQFLGQVSEDTAADFAKLKALSNVRSLGKLAPAELAAAMKRATVGLIPFEDKPVWAGSYPLKALEYVASGLPVVSTHIEALKEHSAVIQFATTAAEFIHKIEQAPASRHDPDLLAQRRRIAAANSYNARFDQAVQWLASLRSAEPAGSGIGANVLVLYDHNSMHVGTIREHLESFPAYATRCTYAFCSATFPGETMRCDVIHAFDAVIIHYCVRVCFPGHLTEPWMEELARYRGLKILFLQDEYDNIEITRRFIEQAGVQVVYSVVPEAERHKVYPPKRFPHVRFIQTLTGYVAADFKDKFSQLGLLHPAQRQTVFAYRGRRLPYYYGTLGEEKREVGDFMKRYCQQHGIRADIETDDTRRIYGDGWWRFLGSARATLGSESGANLFDQEGELRAMLAAYLQEHPAATYGEVRRALHPHFEETVRMNQVSPKVFEAIATRTALVLFEGEYSGVVQPDVHFIPLKKDFSNVAEVVAKVQDDALVEAMTQRAFDDIILAETWSAARFFRHFEDQLLTNVRPRTHHALVLCDHEWFPSLLSLKPLSSATVQELASRLDDSEFRGLKAANHAYLSEIKRLNKCYPDELKRLNEHYLNEIAKYQEELAKARQRGDDYRDKWKQAKSKRQNKKAITAAQKPGFRARLKKLFRR